RRTHKVPHAMGPAYLAGAFSRELCDVRLYSELYSGPLENEQLLAWPDMLVLTGLTTGLDRMRHLTPYARTKNTRGVVVAGGPAVRALPRYCGRFFDYCCRGDVEELREVIAEVFGKDYVAEEMLPRFDLAEWLGGIVYVESSRHCNFHCSFCTLTAERMRYQSYDLGFIHRQILEVGRGKHIGCIDNNFFGNDRAHFVAKLELLRDLWRDDRFDGWSALVTSDFFFDERNLDLAREAGCRALFSGVESFDVEWLRRNNKPQNTRLPQVELIRKTLEAGGVFFFLVRFSLSRPSFR